MVVLLRVTSEEKFFLNLKPVVLFLFVILLLLVSFWSRMSCLLSKKRHLFWPSIDCSWLRMYCSSVSLLTRSCSLLSSSLSYWLSRLNSMESARLRSPRFLAASAIADLLTTLACLSPFFSNNYSIKFCWPCSFGTLMPFFFEKWSTMCSRRERRAFSSCCFSS